MTTLRPWRGGAAAVAAGLLLGGFAPLAAGQPGPTGPTNAVPTIRAVHAAVRPALRVLDHARPSDDFSTHVRRWPGHTISYTSSIPAKWQWGLTHAIAAWNSSGAHVKFVRAKKGHHAQVSIEYGDTQGADGLATIGPARNAYVHLSFAYQHTASNATETVWVGRLFTHELGHVLGFEHVKAPCALMTPIFDMGKCPLLDKDPGYYYCPWVDRPLQKRLVAAYGGKATKQPPGRCLIDPLPDPIGSPQFAGGTTSPVTFSWSAPASAPPGSAVHLQVYEGATCPAAGFSGDIDVMLALGTGHWTDIVDGTAGPHCYRAQVVNQWGAAPPGTQAVLSRYAPPIPAPTVAAGPYSAANGGWSFTATWASTASLVGYFDPVHPATCPAAGAASTQQFTFDHSDPLVIYARSPSECLTFVAKTPGATSPSVQLHLQATSPPAPTVGMPAYDADGDFWSVTVTPVDGYQPVAEVRPGGCPATVPGDLTWPGTPDFFFAAQPGTNCVFVALMDQNFFDVPFVGQVVTRQFTEPG